MTSTRSFAAAMVFAISALAAGVLAPPAAAETVRAVEFYHQDFEHYFVTANPTEIAALDAGLLPGWWRTGQRYRVDNSPAADLVPVCRFFSASFAGKSSHFYTASATECAALKAGTDWQYEGDAFYVRLPDPQGQCGVGTVAINRLYNSGHGGAPNHAYTSSQAKKSTLIDAAWVSEGTAFCVPLKDGDPIERTKSLAGSFWTIRSEASNSADGWGYGGNSFDLLFGFAPVLDHSLDHTFVIAGVAPPGVAVAHSNGGSIYQDPSRGAATWDPIAGSYLVIVESNDDFPSISGWAATFDTAPRDSTTVCVVTVKKNYFSETQLHPFQPYLWSRCASGFAGMLNPGILR